MAAVKATGDLLTKSLSEASPRNILPKIAPMSNRVDTLALY